MAFSVAKGGDFRDKPVSVTGLARILLAIGRLPPFCRGHLRSLTARAILKVAGSPLRTEFRGAVFVVDNDAHTTEHAILLNLRYNSAELEFLTDGLPPGGIAIDLGSNIGLYSLPLAIKAGPQGRVLCIDASANFAARLSTNARLSGLSNIVQEIVAVGDRIGTVSLKAVAGNPGTAVISEEAGDSAVEMRPLLDIIEKHGIAYVDVMKVDIDGSEEIALVPFLRDADASLLPKRIVMEHIMFDSAKSALPEALKRAGYAVYATTRSNSLYERHA